MVKYVIVVFNEQFKTFAALFYTDLGVPTRLLFS